MKITRTINLLAAALVGALAFTATVAGAANPVGPLSSRVAVTR